MFEAARKEMMEIVLTIKARDKNRRGGVCPLYWEPGKANISVPDSQIHQVAQITGFY